MSSETIIGLARGVPSGENAPDPRTEFLLQDQEQQDFNSFLSDIDDGRLSFGELNARLSTQPGSVVFIDGAPLRRLGGREVTEDRQVGQESAAFLRQEADAYEALQDARGSIVDFRSYLRDILRGRISDSEELNTRIRSGNNQTTFMINNELVTEERRVIAPQIEILESALNAREALAEAQETVRGISDLYQRLGRGEYDESNERLDQLIRDQYPNLLMQPGQLAFLANDIDRRRSRNARVEQLDAANDVAQAELTGFDRSADTDRSVTIDTVLSPDDVELVRSVQNGDSELRGRLFQVLQTGDVDSVRSYLDEQAGSLSSDGELLAFRSRRALIEGSVAPKLRRIYLERTILGQITDARSLDDVESVRTTIETADAISVGDESLFASLRNRATQREEELNTQEAWRLATDDVDAALEYTFAIREPADDNRYKVLLGNLYTIEIRGFETEACRLIEQGASDSEFDEFLIQQAQRRPAAGIDFTEAFVEARSRVDRQENYVSNLDATARVLSDLYAGRSAELLLEDIDALLPGIEDADINEALKMRLMTFVALRKDRLPDDFTFLFGDDQEDILSRLKGGNYDFEQGLGRNYAASRYVAENYKTVIQPLFESLRGNGVLGPKLERYLDETIAGQDFSPYRISPIRLAMQRDLSAIESSYLASVELLSQFNPQLIALANVAPELLDAYLENHFSEMDRRTAEELEDDEFVPMAQTGLGIQGVTAAGETARYNPGIAEEVVYFEAESAPGGPFGVPDGPAWLLNSKASTGAKEPTLPDLDPTDEELTVRAYGSPLRWYVGERKKGRDTRPGSINTSVDWLPQSDEFAEGNYPNNEEEARKARLQAAMVLRRARFNTRFVGWQQTDDGQPGDKRLFYKQTDENGEEEMIRVRTDNHAIASGLGKPNFGIDLTVNSTREVFDASETREAEGERPLITDGLNAFKLLSSRKERGPGTGKVWVVYGDGNTTDTLVENLAGIFGKNRGRGELEKIFVVAGGDFDERDRYALIDDVNEKQGRPNITERIEGRVTRIELIDTDDGQKVRFYNGNSLLRDRNGDPIVGDIGVSGAGFTPEIGKLLADEDDPKRFQTAEYLSYQTLPTNPGVAVGDVLNKDEGTILIGTASRTGYEPDDEIDPAAKFLQLPRDSRRALQDNGAGNAVAIGIRGADTQAHMRLFLERRLPRQSGEGFVDGDVSKYSSENVFRGRSGREVIDIRQRTAAAKVLEVTESVALIRDNVERLEAVAEAIVLQALSDTRFRTRPDTPASGIIDISVKLDPRNGTVEVEGAPDTLPLGVFTNPYFVAYARQAIANRKGGGDTVRLRLDLNKGRVDQRKSSLLAA